VTSNTSPATPTAYIQVSDIQHITSNINRLHTSPTTTILPETVPTLAALSEATSVLAWESVHTTAITEVRPRPTMNDFHKTLQKHTPSLLLFIKSYTCRRWERHWLQRRTTAWCERWSLQKNTEATNDFTMKDLHYT